MRYKVEKILSHALQDGEYKLLTLWQGFDDEDATWEPFVVLYEDIPTIVASYVQGLDGTDKIKPALQALMK